MNINQVKFNQVVNEAKQKAANHPAWLRAIDKAARMLASGELVVTLFADDTALATSPNGSYRVNGACPCAARTSHCYHRAAKRLVEMMETAPATTSSAPSGEIAPATPQDVAVRAPRYCGDRDLQHLDRSKPHIARSVERNHNGPRLRVVRCNGWAI